jgi:nucleoside-diphosphate-sugar epimerase
MLEGQFLPNTRQYHKLKQTPVDIRRGARLLIDVGLSGLSFLLAMILRLGFFQSWAALTESPALLLYPLIFSGVCALVYLILGFSSRSWRFVSLQDLSVMICGVFIAIVCFAFLCFLIPGLPTIPRSVPLTAAFVMVTALGGVRVLRRSLNEGCLPFGVRDVLGAQRRGSAQPTRLLAFGASPETNTLLQSLQAGTNTPYQVVGIIDDNPSTGVSRIRGIEVLGGCKDLPQIVERMTKSSIKLESLVVPANSFSRAKLREIANMAATAGLRAVRLPSTCDLLQKATPIFACEPIEVTNPDRVLVIGGAGYIGSVLVEKLLNLGLEVLVLDPMHFGDQPLSRVAGHPALDVICEDFRRIEVVTRAMKGVGSVVHLAGLVGDPACAADPALTIDINVTGTKIVGEIAKARGVRRFIFASSCSVYGASDDILDEESQFNPQSLYARSKVAGEAVLRALGDSSFAMTCLRFATVYGISNRPRFDLVINLLCAKAVRDRVVTVIGPSQWRPFVHVEDVANAVVSALQAPLDTVANEVFNVGSDEQNYTLGETAQFIQSQLPQTQIVSEDGCPDKRNYRVSFKKIRDELGFYPAWSLERGIAQIIASVRSNEVGHYSVPQYSNVLSLKERGTESYRSCNITGWESNFMNVDRLRTEGLVASSTAAR